MMNEGPTVLSWKKSGGCASRYWPTTRRHCAFESVSDFLMSDHVSSARRSRNASCSLRQSNTETEGSLRSVIGPGCTKGSGLFVSAGNTRTRRGGRNSLSKIEGRSNRSSHEIFGVELRIQRGCCRPTDSLPLIAGRRENSMPQGSPKEFST